MATLRTNRPFTNDPSTSHEVVRASIKYHYGDTQICKSAYLLIGSRRLRNLLCHYDENDLSERVHGNTRKRPHNQTDMEVIENIKGFIEQFADNHAMPLPGRLPTQKDYRVMLLPSDMSVYSL